MGRVPLQIKKRLVIAFAIFSAVMTVLCFRAGYIQIVKGEEYTKMAVEQQTRDELVEAQRGDIVDRNGNKLAVSTTRYAVWVRPGSLENSTTESVNKKNKENVISGLTEILDVDADQLRREFDSGKTLVKVTNNVDRKTADQVRTWAANNGYDAISVSEETKREYPLDATAAHVLGSVTEEGNGLSGLELYYNNYLKGIPGRWIQNKDASGRSLSYGRSKYYEAEDGATLVLTIDIAIQGYVEEVVEATAKKYKAEEVTCIVMDTKSGEILAMANYPDYNPNKAREPLAEDKKDFDKMSEEEQLDYLNDMWRNPAVNDTYVPGSTFKLITTSSVLEEDMVGEEETFHDSGSINVSGVNLHCWNTANPHGTQNLRDAVKNSCNPVFVQLAQRLGINKFYDYIGLFGYMEPTGIDYPGEAKAILQDKEAAGPVGLATMGFGQGIAVTPIQQITAVNAIANGGMLVQPHLVKRIESPDGEVIKEFGTVEVRRAVSEKTANQVCDIMGYVIDAGGEGSMKIDGLRYGGKTGTANIEAEKNKIIASFVGVAPINDPEISVLFLVRDPKGGIYGSTVAAPSGRQIIENTMRYLTVEKADE